MQCSSSERKIFTLVQSVFILPSAKFSVQALDTPMKKKLKSPTTYSACRTSNFAHSNTPTIVSFIDCLGNCRLHYCRRSLNRIFSTKVSTKTQALDGVVMGNAVMGNALCSSTLLQFECLLEDMHFTK